MTNTDATATISSAAEQDFPLYFNEWLKRRRLDLDLTQAQLAHITSCTVFTIRKIEKGERRPSRQLAELLAKSLGIPSEEQTTFIKVARGELGVERLAPPVRGSSSAAKSAQTPGNLPRSLTPFIGRESELATLGELLQDPQCPLLTIVGPGGIGKTRLAIEAAYHSRDFFPDGVWFVPLASLSSSEYLIPAIADALKLRFQDRAAPQEQLLNYLHDKRALLVLDNIEHLLDGVGLFAEILKSSAHVKLLVTSRERVNLLSEWVFEIQGLPVPPNDQADQLEDYSATALFLQNTRRMRAGLELRNDERQWVVHICRIMEGMPLGIELAAGWLGVLSCEEIAKEIERNLDFLTASTRDLPERHRSIRAVFDHSWKMLTLDEQQVLSQLSVFRGGFNRQAAEQVAGASLAVLSTLGNRTLLRRAAAGRYELHELVRQYCLTHLEADPRAYAAVQMRHYYYFLALAESAGQELKGRNQLEWLGRLELEHDNLRAALDWALESDHSAPDGDELAPRLAGALRWFWRMRGYFHEGRSWLMKSLQQLPERRTAARAVALLGNSLLLFALGDLGTASLPAEQSASIYRELGDQRGLAEALSIMGAALVWHGEASLGQARLEQALAIFRKAGDRWGEARTLFRLGSYLADYAGDPTGRAMLEQSTAILEDLGEKYLLTGVLTSVGILDMGFGDYAAARARFEYALAIAREIEHPWGIADALTNLGCVYRILGEYSTAQSNLEQALQVYHEHGRSIWETDVQSALAENALSQGDFSTARSHLQTAANLLGTGENKWLQIVVCYFRGLLAYYDGDVEEASDLLGEAVTLAREGTYKPDLARSLIALGRVKCKQGRLLPASGLLREGLELFRALGHKLGIIEAIEALGAVNAVQGDHVQAVMLFGTAHALRQELGAPLPPVDHAAYDSAVALGRTQLGENVFAATWADASTRHFQDVVEEILKNKVPNGLF